MSSEENLGLLPTDLILNIISRLPSKSIARCRCLSKLWESLLTLGSPYFTELFFTHSKTRPRILFAVKRYDKWLLYSCPQPQISYKDYESFLSVTAEFHMSLPKSKLFVSISPSVSGLMYFYKMPDLNNPTLCNPSSRQLFSLPQLTKVVHSYFGYDPINKQFKVLAISHRGPPLEPGYIGLPSSYQILKLGSGRLSWRSLNCPLHHHPFEPNICINGILYYLACLLKNPPHKIVCFDLNSEEFKIIDQPHFYIERLVNFKGKLGVINAKWVGSSKKRSHLQVSLCVLEDAEKQKWSKHVYDILATKLWNKKGELCRIVGMTAMGDIVLSFHYMIPSLYVYFFNLEKKTLRKVEIKDFNYFNGHMFCGCVDYVEELRALNWN